MAYRDSKSSGEVTSKRCTKCKEVKELGEFYRNESSRLGLHSHCKVCQKLKARQTREKNRKRNCNKKPRSKKCFRCKTVKASSAYYRNPGNQDGLQANCINCQKAIARQNLATPRGRAATLVRSARRRSAEFCIPFELRADDIYPALELGLCELSGLPLDFGPPPSGGKRQNPYAPSLDRIVPEKGYVRGNVRIILWSLNAAIGHWGAATFEEIAYRHLLHARPDLVIHKPRSRQPMNDNRQLSLLDLVA